MNGNITLQKLSANSLQIFPDCNNYHSFIGRFQFARDFRYRRFPPFNLRLHSSTTFVAVLKLIETFPMTDKDYQERLQAEAMETAKVKNLANSRYRFQKARERTFHGSKNQILAKFGFYLCNEGVFCYACGFNTIFVHWPVVNEMHHREMKTCPFICNVAHNIPTGENYPEYPEWLHEYSNGDHVDFVVKLGYSRDMVKSLVLRHFDETGTQYKSLSELLADVQKVAEIWVSTENLITEGAGAEMQEPIGPEDEAQHPNIEHFQLVLGFPLDVEQPNNHMRTGTAYDSQTELLAGVQRLDFPMGGGQSSVFQTEPVNRTEHYQPGWEFFNSSS